MTKILLTVALGMIVSVTCLHASSGNCPMSSCCQKECTKEGVKNGTCPMTSTCMPR